MSGLERTATMIGEPVMGGGGAVVPPADCWPRAAKLLRFIMVTAKGVTFGYVPHGALLTNAAASGDCLGPRLTGRPIVGEIRQVGLTLAVESPPTRQHAYRSRTAPGGVVDALREEAGIIMRSNPYGLVINPPLVFTRRDAAELVDGLRSVLSRVEVEGSVR
ncbi:hypothetical protein ACIPPJ_33495 [Streptomyces sp. NPDC086091]|uniref:hypothetical protein n=1 Tax=Streptomyces sp. NPDC086091 TaxID=3365751 RepID=UPI0038096A55